MSTNKENELLKTVQEIDKVERKMLLLENDGKRFSIPWRLYNFQRDMLYEKYFGLNLKEFQETHKLSDQAKELCNSTLDIFRKNYKKLLKKIDSI